MASVAALCLTAGFFAGRHSYCPPEELDRVLPNGLPRSCCDASTTTSPSSSSSSLTEDDAKQKHHQHLLKTLRRIVGKDYILDGREENTKTTAFLKGARLGHGTALAIVQPTKLKQVVEIVQAVADAGCVLLVQGSNTGLTGGSVPRPTDDDRPTVVMSMKHLDTVFPIDDGKRVVCLAGVGLASLKRFVSDFFPDRESHSILGSTFLNVSCIFQQKLCDIFLFVRLVFITFFVFFVDSVADDCSRCGVWFWWNAMSQRTRLDRSGVVFENCSGQIWKTRCPCRESIGHRRI
jgi:D-lactate dehydrogenase